ncbi:hypothetical protein [Streptomyces hebeiensis]
MRPIWFNEVILATSRTGSILARDKALARLRRSTSPPWEDIDLDGKAFPTIVATLPTSSIQAGSVAPDSILVGDSSYARNGALQCLFQACQLRGASINIRFASHRSPGLLVSLFKLQHCFRDIRAPIEGKSDRALHPHAQLRPDRDQIADMPNMRDANLPAQQDFSQYGIMMFSLPGHSDPHFRVLRRAIIPRVPAGMSTPTLSSTRRVAFGTRHTTTTAPCHTPTAQQHHTRVDGIPQNTQSAL